MTGFVTFFVAGIVVGSLYGMLAVSITVLYKTTDVPNFAQGSFALVAAYLTWFTAIGLGLNLWLAIVIGLASSSLVGYLSDRLALRRLLGAPVISLVIFTLGLSIVLNNLAQLIWGAEIREMPNPLANSNFRLGALQISYMSPLVLAIGIVMVLFLMFFFARTPPGLATRAIAQDRISPRYLGINVPAILSASWLGAGLFGGIAGIVLAMQFYLDPSIMDSILLEAMTAAALGGFASIEGAFLGGILLGVAEDLTAAYISVQFKQSITFLVLFAVLLIRPQGLFGNTRTRKV